MSPSSAPNVYDFRLHNSRKRIPIAGSASAVSVTWGTGGQDFLKGVGFVLDTCDSYCTTLHQILWSWIFGWLVAVVLIHATDRMFGAAAQKPQKKHLEPLQQPPSCFWPPRFSQVVPAHSSTSTSTNVPSESISSGPGDAQSKKFHRQQHSMKHQIQEIGHYKKELSNIKKTIPTA